MHVLLCVDDLIIIIFECHLAEGTRVFLLVWTKVDKFSFFSGLQTNLDKSNILLKGQWD